MFIISLCDVSQEKKKYVKIFINCIWLAPSVDMIDVVFIVYMLTYNATYNITLNHFKLEQLMKKIIISVQYLNQFTWYYKKILVKFPAYMSESDDCLYCVNPLPNEWCLLEQVRILSQETGH